MKNNESNIEKLEIKLDKTYKIRKWKAKEKKEFLKIIKTEDNLDRVQDVLVYNCIDGDAAFNTSEFKYVISRLRQYSLGNEIELEFYCDDCKIKFLKTIELDKIIIPIFSNKNEIKTKKHNIKIGSIKNPNFYKQIINENPEYADEYDFYLRISDIDSNDTLTLEEIVEFFDNMDIDEFDEIFKQWEDIKFKVNDIADIECPMCEKSTKYNFDEIPGFFPGSWFK